MRKLVCALLAGLLVLTMPVGNIVSAEGSGDSSPDVPSTDGITYDDTLGYREYLEQHSDAESPREEVSVDLDTASAPDGKTVARQENFDGANTAIIVQDSEKVSFSVSVPAEGLYKIRLMYIAVPVKDIDITVALYIDGKLPFASAAGISLTRVWKDSEQQLYSDDAGNEYRPIQMEEYRWNEVFLSAKDDYIDGGYSFYFSRGDHTISLESVQEGFIIGRLTLCQEEKIPSYGEYLEKYEGEGHNPAPVEAEIQYLEGERADYKSHAVLYPIPDYSSSITRPYDARRSLLNTIGGENWNVKGQWLEWNFEVKTSGFYQVVFRYKQNYKSGLYSVRRLTLDGSVPFAEAASIRFNYGLGWDVMPLGGENPAYLYLTAGKHTLRLEVVYGEFAAVCQEVQSCLDELNSLYRKIMMITGASPDPLRDYNIEKLVPESGKVCRDVSNRLTKIVEKLAEMTGGKGSETAAIEKLAIQLDDFTEDVEEIPQRLSSFNSNISALASWLITATKQPLLLDYIQLAPIGSELPAADAPWYKAAANEIMRFLYSFIEDYDIIQTNVNATEKPVNLWLGVGRDQATVMQSIITNNFTAKTGIPVNLRLISMDVLMRAVASGVGPDLALYQDQGTIINYALRKALYDLSEFDDINSVLSRFVPESTVPFRLGDGLYALPENINFNVMFYRTDVFSDLGLTVPETWDELYDVLAALQKNNMEIGVASSFTTATSNAISPLFMTLLYQRGGRIYSSDGAKCVLNEQSGVSAFTDFCELYTKYDLSLKIDLLTRFRTGEAPLVINNFTFANELHVSAPEINNLWKMAKLPGTRNENGTIDYSTLLSCSGTVMFKNARNKKNTWKFIKWWTGRDAQVEYARQIEAALGRSGRWTSANLEAMEGVAWSREEMDVLKFQLMTARALPEVAGGYYTGRSINNAIRLVVNSKADPKETLYEYIKDINKEIQQKRRELGIE